MVLEISTAIFCPMACSYCPTETLQAAYDGPKLMSVETFVKCLENSPTNIYVSFAGYAEPYLNNQCSRMIGIAVSTFHPVQIYTTGIGMSDADVEMVLRVQPQNFVLHLPDGDGNMQAKVTPEYVKRMQRLADGVKSFKSVVFGSLHPLLNGVNKNLQHHPLISRAGNVTHLTQLNKSGPLKCSPDPLLENHVILPSGDSSICCCGYDLKFIIGNLQRETWWDIQRGPKLAAFRELMLSGNNPMCRACEFSVPCEAA